MTDKEKATAQAEALVRNVLSQTFHQKVDQETLSAVAQKVLRAVPEARSEHDSQGGGTRKVA